MENNSHSLIQLTFILNMILKTQIRLRTECGSKLLKNNFWVLLEWLPLASGVRCLLMKNCVLAQTFTSVDLVNVN